MWHHRSRCESGWLVQGGLRATPFFFLFFCKLPFYAVHVDASSVLLSALNLLESLVLCPLKPYLTNPPSLPPLPTSSASSISCVTVRTIMFMLDLPVFFFKCRFCKWTFWMLFCISLSLVIVSHLSTVRWLRKHRVEWSTVQDFPSPPPLNIINLKSIQPFNLCRSDMNWLISLLWVRLLYARCVARAL